MAKDYYGSRNYLGAYHDFNQGELRNVVIHPTGTAPASPVQGQIYTDPTAGPLVWHNSAWRSLLSSGGDVTGPASSVDGEIALLSGATGKVLKRASVTGLLKGTAGVLSAAVAGTDYLAPDAELTAIAGLTSAADRVPYYTGSGTAALAVLTAFARTLLDDADAATMRTTLGAAPTASPTFTGTVTVPDDSFTLAKLQDIATASFLGRVTASTGNIEVLTTAQAKTALALVKADVGLGNVDNTSDANKPVSTAQQTALNLKANLASPTFTGTVIVPTATNSGSPVTKAQLDAVSQGIFYKAPVRVATTANITLSGTQTIDGVAVVAGNRVLVKDQSTASQNGIYTVAAGAWTRGVGSDTAAEIGAGATVFVDEGTVNGNTMWSQTETVVTLGTSAIVFVKIFQAADLATLGVAKKVVANFGDGTNTTFTITHNLGTKDVQVEVIRNSDDAIVDVSDILANNVNSVSVGGFTTAPTANQFRAVVVG